MQEQVHSYSSLLEVESFEMVKFVVLANSFDLRLGQFNDKWVVAEKQDLSNHFVCEPTPREAIEAFQRKLASYVK